MHRTWRTWVASAVVTAVVAALAIGLASRGSAVGAGAAAATDAATTTGTATTTDTTTTPDTSTTADATDAATSQPPTPSTAALDAIDTSARFAVSVVDVTDGADGTSLDYGDGTFDTASIVKVDILAALLWQHQEAGTTLSSTEQALAEAMIERSDNDAATTLFRAVGGEAGLEAFDAMIGLTSTDVGSGGNWGLTQTTTADQLRVLEVVLGKDGDDGKDGEDGEKSVLSAASRSYARELMSDVVDTQRFGVAAAADDPDAAVLKVGYLQRSTTGRWDVTSIGEVEAGGRTYLVAVLSDGSATFDAGKELVDAVATAAVEAVAAA